MAIRRSLETTGELNPLSSTPPTTGGWVNPTAGQAGTLQHQGYQGLEGAMVGATLGSQIYPGMGTAIGGVLGAGLDAIHMGLDPSTYTLALGGDPSMDINAQRAFIQAQQQKMRELYGGMTGGLWPGQNFHQTPGATTATMGGPGSPTFGLNPYSNPQGGRTLADQMSSWKKALDQGWSDYNDWRKTQVGDLKSDLAPPQTVPDAAGPVSLDKTLAPPASAPSGDRTAGGGGLGPIDVPFPSPGEGGWPRGGVGAGGGYGGIPGGRPTLLPQFLLYR